MGSFPLHAGRRDDDSNRFWSRRSAQLAHEALHGFVSTAEPVVGNHVLPDGHGIAASAQSKLDGVAKRLARTGRRIRWRKLDGLFFRNLPDKVGDHLVGRF